MKGRGIEHSRTFFCRKFSANLPNGEIMRKENDREKRERRREREREG